MEKEKEQLEQDLINIKVRLKDAVIFEIPMSLKDSIGELRAVISDLPELYFSPNYHFQHDGKKIEEMEEMEKYLPPMKDKKEIEVWISFDDYTLRTMKDLLSKANEFFEAPKKVAATLKYNSNFDLGQINFFDILQQKKKKNKSKAKISLDRVLNQELTVLSQISLHQNFKPTTNINQRHQYIKVLEYSHWNPPPKKRKMAGDFFYLRFITIEGEELHITAFSKGFFLNRSTTEHFDPTPDSESFYSLIDLFSTNSELFKAKAKLGLFNSLKLEVKHIELPLNQKANIWLRQEELIDNHNKDGFRSTADIYCTFGYNPTIFKDWNEEMINCRNTEAKELLNKLNQKKSMFKINQSFLENAILGAKAIIDGDITPFNVNMSISEQCFVHNNIFYTYALDNYNSLTQQKGDTAPTTLASSKDDLRNMSIISSSGLKELNTINTALVYYKGRVMVAQTMIQGILHFDQHTWSKYGSIDEGVSIKNDVEFVNELKKISQLFLVKDKHIFLDKKGNEHEMASSLDIKGIVGGDRRKYILDVVRMSPRDLNWFKEGDYKEYNSCVLRLELIHSYSINKRFSVIQEIQMSFKERLMKNKEENLVGVQKRINDLKAKSKEKIKIELTEEEKKKIENYNKINIEIEKEIGLKVKQRNKEEGLDDFRLNQCLYTDLNMEKYKIDKSVKIKDEQMLQDVAKFARESMVNRIVVEWPRMMKLIPLDSESLGTFLHKYGLNVRYLGLIAKTMENKMLPSYLMLARRTMIVRSLKHFLNKVVSEVDYIQLTQTISHLLNCICGNSQVAKILVKYTANLEQGVNKANSGSGSSDHKKKKKKNKKQRKHNIKQVECDLLPNKYQLMNPKKLFEEINNICEYRFLYKFKEKEFHELEFKQTQINTFSLLREITRAIGVVIQMRTYDFSSQEEGHCKLPIKAADILEFVTKTKFVKISTLKEIRSNLDMAHSAFKQKKYDLSNDLFQFSLNMLINVHGPFCAETIDCAIYIATIKAIKGQLEQAISTQKIIYKICEKTFGIDNIKTIGAMNDLAGYYYKKKNLDKAKDCLLKSLYLSDLLGGEFNPESLKILDELNIIFIEMKDLQQSIQCCHEKIERIKKLFKESHPFVLLNYQKLGNLYYQIGDHQKALDYYELKHSFLVKFHRKTMPGEIININKAIQEIKKKINVKPGEKNNSSDNLKFDMNIYKEKIRLFRSQRENSSKHF